jgi:hypothetical protein
MVYLIYLVNFREKIEENLIRLSFIIIITLIIKI